VSLDEAHGRIGEHVGDEALRRRADAVVLGLCIEVVREEAAAEAEEVVEALAACSRGMIGTVVPFAKAASDIASGFQHLGERGFVAMHHFEAVRGIDHIQPRMMPPGEQRRACRRADGADVEMLKFDALSPQFVERRRGELVVAMATQITPAHVIGEDEEDIGLRILLCRCRGFGQRCRTGGSESKIIRTEGRCGQVSGVVEITGGVVRPRIAHGDGCGYLC
jgi:hypothetical protein